MKVLKNWDDLKFILALSRYGTMSAAAKAMEINIATVSRRIESVSDECGTTLFVRRGNYWKPTTEALPLIAIAETIDERIIGAQNAETCQPGNVRHVKISVPPQICDSAIGSRISDFLNKDRYLKIEIFHEIKSLAFGEVDLQVTLTEPTEGRLIRKFLGRVGYCAYKGAQLQNPPTGFVDLVDPHRCEGVFRKQMEADFGSPDLVTSSIYLAICAVQEARLIAFLPVDSVKPEHNLVRWKPEEPVFYLALWVSYHESRKLDPDVQLATQFVKSCV